MPDPIIDEIHATRERIAARHGFDLHAIAEEARKSERDNERLFVSKSPRVPYAAPTKRIDLVRESDSTLTKKDD